MRNRLFTCAIAALFPALLGVGALADTPSPAAVASADWPERVYGASAEFTILRDGKPVGRHMLRFQRDNGDLIVDARSDIAVKLLGFTMYSFEYHSRSVWRDGQLEQLTAIRTENGERQQVEARRQDGLLRVSGPSGANETPRTVFPTDHWHPGALQSELMLNTLTGGLEPVRVRRLDEPDDAAGAAHRYAYEGGFRAEVWYDRDWRWTRLRFAARDGSSIEYVCTSCTRLAAGTDQ